MVRAELVIVIEVDVRDEEELIDIVTEIADRIFGIQNVESVTIGNENEVLAHYTRRDANQAQSTRWKYNWA